MQTSILTTIKSDAELYQGIQNLIELVNDLLKSSGAETPVISNTYWLKVLLESLISEVKSDEEVKSALDDLTRFKFFILHKEVTPEEFSGSPEDKISVVKPKLRKIIRQLKTLKKTLG